MLVVAVELGVEVDGCGLSGAACELDLAGVVVALEGALPESAPVWGVEAVGPCRLVAPLVVGSFVFERC